MVVVMVLWQCDDWMLKNNNNTVIHVVVFKVL
jgi:hypothetical protein